MKTTALKVKNIIAGLLILFVINIGFSQYSVSTDGKHHSIKISKNGLSSFKIDYNGTIEVSDDDKDVKSISSGGFLEISKTVFGNQRTIRIEPSGSGLKRKYNVGRQEVEYDPEGKNWLAEILPEVVRSSGVGAKSRVERFYKKGGISAVINELEEIDSDYVEAMYASILLDKSNLSSTEIVEAIGGISDEIHSDYYLSNVLKDNRKKLLKNDETAIAYFEAIQEIDSDYYASVVLKEGLEQGLYSEKQAEAIVNAAKNIGSDYYMSSVFQEVMKNNEISDEIITVILSATDEIGSDHYQTEVLKDVINRDHLSSEIQKALLEVVGNISSDHYMSVVFNEMLEKDILENELIGLMEVIKNNMSSDHYANVVLHEMVEGQKMSDQIIKELSEVIGEMSSDHYASEILKELAKEDITESQVIILLDAASEISSDHYLTTVLLAFAERVNSGSTALKEAYRKAAKSINSNSYYGKVVKAID
ncbi:MAG: hypothetical protein OEX22_02455 [Cyclobacteriaceae bacterium]|nr:hypothetical protein [Cyclobacteriaceae bacterium]